MQGAPQDPAVTPFAELRVALEDQRAQIAARLEAIEAAE
jgi:hypothetical protein